MISIAKHMDEHDIVQEVRLERKLHKGSFLLVEGTTDIKRFGAFIDDDECSLVNCYGRKNAVEAIKLLYEDGFPGALGVVDADFGRLDDSLVLRVIQRIHKVVRMCDIGAWFGAWSHGATDMCGLEAMEREQLAAIAAARNRPRKHVERARIVLASADRHSPQRVAHSIGVSRPTVWRWQQRFAESGVEGLLRDKTRKPGKAPIAVETTARVVALTCAAPPHQATHWTGRAMAKAIGISLGSVQRIWRAHKLQPHRLRTFKRSCDPGFVAKLTDIVGLYVDPPAHAVVLSIDEKSQIQALDRTQPRLPIKPGRCQTMTHDYKRHGTTTLFAALSVLDGTVIGRCMQRHRHIEFIRFLNTIERHVPAGKLIHTVLDNYATHKHPKSLPSRKRGVLAWLARHPRWVFHFTPTSASWLNAVENVFSKMTRQRIRRGVFRSIVDLQTAINAYLAEHNVSPKPFVWTKSAEVILAKLNRLPVTSL